MTSRNDSFIRVGTLDEIAAKGRVVVVVGRHCPVLVVFDRGRICAMDNRCPHLGFPLHRGTLEDGILTCHWHHARFDVTSGGTFDLWADDVPTFAAKVVDGHVWVATEPARAKVRGRWRRRLREGMEHDLGLVIAKAVLAAMAEGADWRQPVGDAIRFGARFRDGWNTGQTVLTALANVLPGLGTRERYLALFQGILGVADDCQGEAARRDRLALDGSAVPMATLKVWLRQWTRVRHRDAAERTLMTAIAAGAPPARLADMLLSAVTDRFYADGGHALDFINKAFEALDLIGWQHAAEVLPTVIGHMVGARGSEESHAWRSPVDMVELLASAFQEFPAIVALGRARRGEFTAHSGLADALLGDDPAAIVGALKNAAASGAKPTDLSRALAYAAALRIARFGTSNEFSDWDTAHHVFTYSNALHQLLKRVESDADTAAACGDGMRGVFHGAVALYLTRYLNVPPARLPGEGGDRLDDLPADAETLQHRILDAFDRRDQVDAVARLAARYLDEGHPAAALIQTLARVLLREDAGFHAYQIFEAAARQFQEWGDGLEGRRVLIAASRYLAAHFPTERSRHQTADIAERLHSGGAIHEEAEETGAPGAA